LARIVSPNGMGCKNGESYRDVINK